MKNRVVINVDYGGYGLSDKARELFIEKLGYTPIKIVNSGRDIFTVKEKIKKEHLKYFYFYEKEKKYIFDISQIQRHDPILVDVVKTLEENANTESSKLIVVEMLGCQYTIIEYDGWERLLTPYNIDWTLVDTPENRKEYPEYFI